MTRAPEKLIRVLIVEDSDVVRLLLERTIEADPRLRVAASVRSAEEALDILGRVAPDVISMDIRLPGMNGMEATRQIMATRPTPIVVVSASVESDDLRISINALKAGALSIVEKPVGVNHVDYGAMAKQLCRQLVLMSDVKLVRQRRPERAAAPPRRPQSASVPAAFAGRSAAARPTVLGVVASTGGPNALAEVLGAIAPDFPMPILVVQHIAPAFLRGFADWLASMIQMPLAVAGDGVHPLDGHVYLAPADKHMILEGGRLRLRDGPTVCGHRPSGTVLFGSLARAVGPAAAAVLLTGMGEDGAEGMRDIRKAGGFTIAEDETTCVVYGMPAAAEQLGAVSETLPLSRIAPRLRQLAAERRLAIS